MAAGANFKQNQAIVFEVLDGNLVSFYSCLVADFLTKERFNFFMTHHLSGYISKVGSTRFTEFGEVVFDDGRELHTMPFSNGLLQCDQVFYGRKNAVVVD
jgi:hypothetical protein